jgi:hypothetical protein
MILHHTLYSYTIVLGHFVKGYKGGARSTFATTPSGIAYKYTTIYVFCQETIEYYVLYISISQLHPVL